MKGKLAITTSSFARYSDRPLQLCKEAGYEVVINPYKRKLSEKELLEVASDACALVAGTENITESALAGLSSLRVISRCGVGMDNVDLDACRKRKIKVYNTPEGPTLAVAELAAALILNLLRKVNKMDSDMKRARWDKLTGNLLCGKKVAVIGLGRIGLKVARLLAAFGAELAYCDLEDKPYAGSWPRLSLNDCLSWADIITVHLSGSVSVPVLGPKELALMKQGSWLVNLSRGGVVDEEALHRALSQNHLAGCACDVFSQEPYTGPLAKLDNVILTPHVGSYAKEARINMEIEAVENALRGLSREG